MNDSNKFYRESNNTQAQLKPMPTQDNSLVNQGKSNAVTINTPFTVIPGLPALNRLLASIDKTTHQDLGFTFKLSANQQENNQGETAFKVSLDYAGFGIMSSKFNVQYSPVSAQIESGKFNHEPHWGCSASVLSAPMGLVHERAGVKGTFTDCSSTRTFSSAPEFSYQKSSSFKPLSTATGGYFFGDVATLNFSISHVDLPTLESIKNASPDIEEWKTIADHILPSIPALQIGRLIEHNIELVTSIFNPATTTEMVALSTHKQYRNEHRHQRLNTASLSSATPHEVAISAHGNSQLQEKNKLPSFNERDHAIENNTHYVVQKNDTLSGIGKKTGCQWREIFELNKLVLNHNPDRIYPGQTLLIPSDEQHAQLMKHPIVQARILENFINQQAIIQSSER